MRTLIAAMGLAAFAALPATAQTGVSRGSAPVAPSQTGTGSTATTTTASTMAETEPVLTAPAPDAVPSSSVAGNVPTPATVQGPRSDPNNSTPSFGPGGPFSNDSGNRALGRSPGQTSTGTLVGNSSPGLGVGSATLGVGLAGMPGTVTEVPEGNVSVIAAGPSGARVIGSPSAQVQQGSALAASNTPLFDQAAREGLAREQRRRAQGDEPRIYGIAPNTERDLTWQMPDDPIIRY